MAAATINFQRKFSVGNVIVEWINATVTDAETVVTLMQRPLHALGVVNADQAVTNQTNVTISGKTLTVNNADLSDDEVNILVVGF